MGIYLDRRQSDNEKKKQMFVFAIILFTFLGLIWKIIVTDPNAMEERRQSHIEAIKKHELKIEEKERQVLESLKRPYDNQ